MRASAAALAHDGNQAAQSGLTIQNLWDTSGADARTRSTHVTADGQAVPFSESFLVGSEQMRYPRDPRASGAEGSACTCVILAVLEE